MTSSYHLKLKWFIRLVQLNPYLLIALATIIPVVGIIVNYIYLDSNSIAFPRSGALLVCLAVMSVYVNHYVGAEVSTHKFFLELGRTKGHPPKLPPEMGEEACREFDEHLKRAKSDQTAHSTKTVSDLENVKDRIVTIEFSTGVLGTFIWGFGDLFIEYTQTFIKLIAA